MFSIKSNIVIVTIFTFALGTIVFIGNSNKVFKLVENGMISKTIDGLFPIILVGLLFAFDLFGQICERKKTINAYD
ncbi:MAG: hypothetical protein FWC41_00335 [Firmicutes bacterium]|nr:hypothetical protein [Bacillota bacterium]